MKSNRKYSKLRIFLVLATIIGIIFFDLILGRINETGINRSLSYEFRSEVSPLSTSTLHLLPQLNDEFPPEGNSLVPRYIRTNNYGLLIGPDYSVDPNTATKILFLGGSTTENNEVDEEYRFPYLVGKLLTEKLGRPYLGVNGGVRGHTSQNSINFYINHPAPLISNAELVVVMHNINDRLRLKIFDGYKSQLNHISPISGEFIWHQIKSLIHSAWTWLTFHSNILYIVNRESDHLFDSGASNKGLINERTLDGNDNLNLAHVELYKNNLRLMIGVIKANKKVPILMTQPLGKSSIGQNAFNDALRSVASELNVYVIDLDSFVKRQEDPKRLFYPDYIHFNNDGSSFAANYIAGEMIKILKNINNGK